MAVTTATLTRTVAKAAVVAGAALLVKHAMGRRVERSPLWPMPALEHPVSGTMGQRRAGSGRERRAVTITERTEAADGVIRLRLTALDGASLPSWEPGAHLDLVLPSGLVRQYSLCGDPAEADTYVIATRLTEDSRGGSREVHERLREAAEVEIRGPRNRFPLAEAPAYLFLAGGIGITPLLPMIRAAERSGVPWQLVYGGRTRASMPFLEELEALGAGANQVALQPLEVQEPQEAPEKREMGRAGPTGPTGYGGRGRVTIVARDESGHPDLAGALDGLPDGVAVYCCGPEPLMDAVTALCGEEGRAPGGGLHLERFSASASVPAGANRPFEVELRRSGRTLTVPADSTALATIRAANPNTPYSCEQGFCGTCQTPVLEGGIDHRDELLTDAERDDSMLICVSRACGPRLALDL